MRLAIPPQCPTALFSARKRFFPHLILRRSTLIILLLLQTVISVALGTIKDIKKEVIMVGVRMWSIAAMCCIALFSKASFSIVTITQPVKTSFGTYVPELRSFTPSAAAYTVPDSLKGVLYADRYTFSDTVRALLEKNGFAAVPANAQSMIGIYKATNDNKLPVFITSDAVLQSFYKSYDYMLRIAEYQRFHAELDSMLHAMLSEVTPLRSYSGNDSLKLAVTRAAAYLDVAHTLLTDTIIFANDPAVRTLVVAETSLVYKHLGFAASNVVPQLIEDFSQYVPRGHYTLDTRFEHYFRCMMYLGRMNLRDTSRIETMQACLLTRLLATSSIGATKASDLWAKIYNPTTFFVGRSDDLNFQQYSDVLDRAVGVQWRTGDIGVFYAKLKEILAELKKLPQPLILSGLDGTPGFRMMGQRFVPDSYMFGQLVFGHVGTAVNPRVFPRGLDLMAILGSARARSHLIDLYHEDKYLNYTRQLDSLTLQFATKPAPQWADNLYWNWLYTLVPLLQTPGKGYPFFMTTQAWADKSLASASGSWAELRHASILYAKQSYSGTTGIPCPHAISFPQGYVEPNPDAFGRLAAMVSYMKTGFDSVGLGPILPLDKLTSLSTICIELRDIAIDELQGGEISLGNYRGIAGLYKTLARIEDFSNYRIPPTASIVSGTDSSTACIVDVHTDPNTGKVLEVGAGKPMCLYVIVPVEGRLQVCRGAMFSYYEFTHAMGDRLTDAQWQAMLANSNTAMPEWTASFTASNDRTAYKTPGEDLTELVSVNDSVPATCKVGDSVIALLQSDATPTITVDSKMSQQIFVGSPVGTGRYRIAILPQALTDTNILTINSSQTIPRTSMECDGSVVPLSYRKVLVRGIGSRVAATQRIGSASARPRVIGNRLLLPPGTTWRIVDIRGRQVAFIGPETREWVPSPRSSALQLILVPVNGRLQQPMRFVIGN
jgi:hypothetical protein